MKNHKAESSFSNLDNSSVVKTNLWTWQTKLFSYSTLSISTILSFFNSHWFRQFLLGSPPSLVPEEKLLVWEFLHLGMHVCNNKQTTWYTTPPVLSTGRVQRRYKMLWAIAYIECWDKWVDVTGGSIIERIVEMASLQFIFLVHLIQSCIKGCRCAHLVQQTWTGTCTTLGRHAHTVHKLQQLNEVIVQFRAKTILTLRHTSTTSLNTFSLSGSESTDTTQQQPV